MYPRIQGSGDQGIQGSGDQGDVGIRGTEGLSHIMMSCYRGPVVQCSFPACEEGPGICTLLITVFSLMLIVASLPLSLFCVIKVVQVRAVTQT